MFEGWDNYFLMMGSAGGGLIGLLFVVITLTAGLERDRAQRGQALFMTPTMVHFAVVLSISAVAEIPKLPSIGFAALAALALGLGLVNSARASVGIARPRPNAGRPHWSDLPLYGILPASLYVLGLGFCVAISEHVAWAGAAIATLLLVLLLVAIRNAWDLVISIAPMAPRTSAAQPAQAPPGA
jgi:hypothetical protein